MEIKINANTSVRLLEGTKIEIIIDHVSAGRGRWAGRVVDCAAVLPDETYDEIDDVISALILAPKNALGSNVEALHEH